MAERKAEGRNEADFPRDLRRHETVERLGRIGHWYLPAGSRTVRWSREAARICGHADADRAVPLELVLSTLADDDRPRLLEALSDAIAGDRDFRLECTVRSASGDRTVRIVGGCDRDPDGGAAGVLAVVQDISEYQEANARLAERNAEMARAHSEIRRAALHDDLTGLPNRRHLEDRLAGYFRRRRDGEFLGLLQIDLDRFKQINETLGHATGDAVLRHVARVLLRRATPEDFVARIGGDEFALVAASIPDERGLELLARELIEDLARPVVHGGRQCWIGASIGIAAAHGAVTRPADLLVNADIALYRAKTQGRGSCRSFSDRLQREIVRHKDLADSLLAGLERGEFVPYYQPQICARTFDISGVEALARWRHPVEGLLPPASFLGIAEDLGVIGSLDGSILATAVEDLGRWRADGLEIPKLSVNISARRLVDRDLIGGIAGMALPPGALAFELLETAFLDDPTETVAWNIDMLKEMGIRIELDDFGSGHASIVSLVRLGPDALKIARELVAGIVEDRTRCGLVRSIVEIGRTLGTRVIAEGVETAAQAELLAEMGCHALQGYHFAAPMPAAEFPAFAERWRAGMNRVHSRAG